MGRYSLRFSIPLLSLSFLTAFFGAFHPLVSAGEGPGDEDPGPFTLSGRLKTPDGIAVSGCAITLKPKKIGEFPDAERLEPIQKNTGQDGRFLFEGLPKGIYCLDFSPGKTPGDPFKYKVKFAETLSSGIYLFEGNIDFGDLTLWKMGVRVTGTVYFNGNPKQKAEVFLLNHHKDLMFQTNTDEEGGFVLDLPFIHPRETISLMGRSGFELPSPPGPQHVQTYGFTECRAASPWSSVHAELHIFKRDGNLEGVVQDLEGNPIRGANLFLYPGKLSSPFCWVKPVTTGQEGRFAFKGIIPGKWNIAAIGDGALRTWKAVEIKPGQDKVVRIEMDVKKTGSLVFSINNKGSWGEYEDFIGKTSSLRSKKPVQFGVFLSTPEGSLIRPCVPIALVFIRDRIPETRIKGFSAGSHHLLAMPVRERGPSGKDRKSQIQFMVAWEPVDPWVPLGGLCVHVPIGPFGIDPGKETRWNKIPYIHAKDIERSSALFFPFEGIPEVLAGLYKNAMAKELVEKCQNK